MSTAYQIGGKNGFAKLTDDDARLIRELCRERSALQKQLERLRFCVIATKFGVSTSTVRDIASGKSWAHVS